MTLLYYILPLIGGIAVSIQVLLNGVLEKHVGRLLTALISHIFGAIFGLIILIIIFAINKKNFFNSTIEYAPWYSFFGGIFGFCVVFFVLVSTNKIPFTLIVALVTIGQLLFGAFIDHFGVLNFHKYPFTIYRFFGICSIIIGAYLIKK